MSTGPRAPTRGLTTGLVLTVSVVAFEALAVATVLPATAGDLGGVSLYGWAFSAFMLAQLVTIGIAGRAVDERGPAGPFGAGLVLFTAGLLACGLAPSMAVLVLGRVVQGAGAGAMTVVVYAAVGRGYPETARPRAMAYLSSAWVVPGLVAPALGGVVAEHLGWRWVFLGLGAMPVVAAGLVLPALRRLPPEAGTGPLGSPVLPGVRLAAGAGLALGGLGGLGSGPALVDGLVIAGGLALAVPAARSLLPPPALSDRPGLPVAVAVRVLNTYAFFGADAFLALALASVRGLSPSGVGLALTAATLTWTAGSWLQARLAGRVSRRSLVVGGQALGSVGIALAAAVLSPGVPVPVAAVAWGLAGLGQGLAMPTISLIALSAARPGEEGAVSASVQLAEVLGVALGTGTGGALVALALASDWDRRAGLAVTFAVMLGVALTGLLAASRLPADHRRGGPAPAAPLAVP